MLGALLYDNAVFERLGDNLQARHFFEPFHGRLYGAIETSIRKGQLAEPILIAEQFARDPAFEELGGLRYLANLVDRAPPSTHAPDYARAIYDLALRRDLIRIGQEIATGAQTTDGETSARDQIEAAEQQLYALAETGSVSQGFVPFADALHGAVAMAAEAHARDGGLAGLSTGLIDLDQKIGGLHPSDLVILAARPSMGKTSLACNIAFDVARNFAWEPRPDGTRKTVSGGVVAFFSLEMSAEQLAMRLLAEASGVSGDRLRKGEIDAMEFGRVRDAALEIQEARVQEVSAITQGLKALAKELSVPVIALSQLSRQVENREDKRPQLSDLRESGSIEQDADMVMFIYRESYYLSRTEPREGTEEHFKWQEQMDQVRGLAEIVIGKQRHGPIGTVKLSFHEDLTKFGNLARDGRYDPH